MTFSLGAACDRPRSLWRSRGRSSHIVSPARDAKSRLSSYQLPSRLPDASGHYTQSVSYADLNLALRF